MKQRQKSSAVSGPFYSPAPDLEILPLGPGSWLCHSATSMLRLEGPAARLLIERVLPILQESEAWERLTAHISDMNATDLRRMLDQLVSQGILRQHPGPLPEVAPALAPLLDLLATLNLPAEVALARLAAARIGIIGLEGAGAHLAVLLARCGVQHLTLVDPYPCQPGNLPLWPVGGAEAVSQPRQALIAQAMCAASPAPEQLALTLGPDRLGAADIDGLVAGCDCVISCFDRGFAAIHHWVNRACLRAGIPAVYMEAKGQLGWAGPLVLPGQTACYMCYRMRAAACAPDPNAALAYERHLDGQYRPRLHERALLPSLMPQLAGALATVVLQVAVGLASSLAGRVLAVEGLTMQTSMHAVIRQPDCPDCGGSLPPTPPPLTLTDLPKQNDSAVDLVQIAPDLISPQTGIIREVGWYDKEAAEPALPYIYRVTLANYHFQTGVAPEDLTCWGKGRTPAEARVSGLGEALERYAGDWVDPAAIVYARRVDLDGPSLDPADLVLYAPEQYATLPYHPYAESSILGWVRARSFLSGATIYIPALAAFLGYPPQRPEEYLFPVTSNGLAAGIGLPQAILAATYEVLERDAFMIAWFGRLPSWRVDPARHPDAAIRDLCAAYRRRGVELGLWRLPTDHPCAVFLALALQADARPGPAAVAALGADLDPAVAARKALLEVGQIRPSYRRSLRRLAIRRRLASLVANPLRVATMHDHGLLYCCPALRPALAFLLERPLEAPDWTPVGGEGTPARLSYLATTLRDMGRDLLYYNLTPPDLARWGLAACRVIVPGLQPMSFGAPEVRLGGTRLYELPHQLGLCPRRLERADLNPYPHPFD